MSKLLSWYLRSLETRPLITNAITSGFIVGSGDLLCQLVVERKALQDVQPERVARFACMGFFFVGPAIRGWYGILERLYGVKGRTVGLKKVLTDQSLFAPTFMASFLTINSLLQRKSLEEVKEHLRKDYISVLKANYMVWPATQLVTFYIIPFHHRVLFVNSVAMLFNSYLSWKTNQKSE